MPTVIDSLIALDKALATVETRAANTTAAVTLAVSSATSAAAETEAHASRITTAQATAQGALLAMSSHASEVERVVDTVGSSVDRLAGQAQRAQTLAEEVAAKVKEAEGKLTAFDDLLQQTANSGNVWEQQLHALIDAAKVGAANVNEILRLYGDAQTAGGRVRDLISNEDIALFTRNLGNWIAELNQGHKTLAEVIDFVGQSQFVAAQTLKTALEAFREGKVTIDRIRQILDQIQAQFAGTEFADLAEALERSLAEGGLR